MKLGNVLGQNEIAAHINNATLAIGLALNLSNQSEERKRRILEYSQALLEILYEDVEDGYFKNYEELVQMLLGAACWSYAVKVTGNLKPPAFQDMAASLIQKIEKKKSIKNGSKRN